MRVLEWSVDHAAREFIAIALEVCWGVGEDGVALIVEELYPCSDAGEGHLFCDGVGGEVGFGGLSEEAHAD